MALLAPAGEGEPEVTGGELQHRWKEFSERLQLQSHQVSTLRPRIDCRRPQTQIRPRSGGWLMIGKRKRLVTLHEKARTGRRPGRHPGEHLTEEEWIAYYQNQLGKEQSESAQVHLMYCFACRGTLAEVQALLAPANKNESVLTSDEIQRRWRAFSERLRTASLAADSADGERCSEGKPNGIPD
jgi:hypothetical protein